MWKTRLEEAQAGIKIAGRNINFRYSDNTTLMAESKEDQKSFLMKANEESETAGLKLNIQQQQKRSWHLVPSLHGKSKGKNW